jgi:hypothetical protein
MIRDWSQEVRHEYAGGDARYEFPVRPLGRGRWVGLFLVGFSVLFVWHPAHDICHTIHKWLHETPGMAELLFSLFDLPFAIFGCVPMAIGLLILFGRCRVEWKDGQLRTTEILGPLHWTRRLPRKPISKLEVSAATSRSGNSAPRQLDGFSGLAAMFEDGSKKLVVLGYPKDWLLALAEELKGYVGGSALSTTPTQVEVVETTLKNENDEDVLQQPADSRVQVEEHTAGVTLTVPPPGLWRGSMGLFFFSLLWCAFMGVFTTIVVSSGVKMNGSIWVAILAMFGFWAVGLGMMAIAINLGRRTATFAAEGGRLRVETKSLFGARQLEWSSGEINAIRADASNMKVNHRPVLELQIHPVTGKKVGLLTGRNENELRWMATRLRQALKVPARKPET